MCFVVVAYNGGGRRDDIWAHFGFYEQSGKHDLEKTHAVCKSCHAQIKYEGGNTTNLRNHVSRFHPELLRLVSAKYLVFTLVYLF